MKPCPKDFAQVMELGLTSDELSGLLQAVQAGDLAAAQAAVANSASVHALEWSFPLQIACLWGHLEVAQWLHGVGASLNAIQQHGWTPLHQVCFKGHLAVAQWLHSVGAPLNATDSVKGEAPLHHACSAGHLEIAQWLCSVGADATIKTSAGSTPAQLLQLHARTAQLDQQALCSTLACLARQAQAQGPLPCTAASVQALILTQPPPCADDEASGAQVAPSEYEVTSHEGPQGMIIRKYVEVRFLVQRLELNGRQGVVAGAINGGRCPVLLDGESKPLSLRATCLVPLPTPAEEPPLM